MQHASYSALEALQIHHGLSYAYGLACIRMTTTDNNSLMLDSPKA